MTPVPAVPKTSATLEFTILGLKKEDIDAVKADIDKCCSEEATDKYVSGPEFSDIIQCLDQSKVNLFIFKHSSMQQPGRSELLCVHVRVI